MKILFSFLALSVLSLPAFALEPVRGHMAHYEQMLVTQGVTTQGETEKMIENIMASDGIALTRSLSIYQGTTTVLHLWVALKSLHYLDDTRAYCQSLAANVPHQLETITVPAGTFLTCWVKQDLNANSHYQAWYSSEVPFGVVKDYVEFNNGDSSARALTNYSL